MKQASTHLISLLAQSRHNSERFKLCHEQNIRVKKVSMVQELHKMAQLAYVYLYMYKASEFLSTITEPSAVSPPVDAERALQKWQITSRKFRT